MELFFKDGGRVGREVARERERERTFDRNEGVWWDI